MISSRFESRRLNYFAYGSNMSSKRLKARVPSAEIIGTGVLQGHRLAFHKVSVDESGKCDIVTSKPDRVFGVLFRIDTAEKRDLDAWEGLGRGYAEKTVNVQLETGVSVPAVTYFATRTDPNLKPYTWYKHHVLEGAREARLPPEYLKFLEDTTAIEDTNKQREERELAIYR